ncbi:MAG: hypothetical protein P4M05_07560 [Bradyrhizobium sp.]|nr:hypothetical protein [Bradyrhizobium sp.]
MAGVVYGGKFEQTMNELCSPNNIAATAKKFADLERQHGPYNFGRFARLLMPNPSDFANWEKDAGGIPEPIRDRLTEIISANLRSATPLPVVLKVGDNVDTTHELIVKAFAHKGNIYIGIHMLCPNPELK